MIVKERVHKHRWVPIPGLEKFAQRLCSCGAISAPGGVKAGRNTVTVNPGGSADVIRWSSSAGSNQLGDLGMEASSGRNRIFVGGSLERYAVTTDQDGGRKWSYNQNPDNTTITSVGTNLAPNTNGAAGVLPISGDGQYIQYTSAAVANSDAGWVSASGTETARGFCPYFECFLNIGAVGTNIRIWVGLFSSPASLMGTSTPSSLGISGAGFRFDTSAGDAGQWRVVTSDGVSTTVKALDGTGGAAVMSFAPGASYLLRVSFPLGGGAIFSGSQLAGVSFQTIPQFSIITTLPAVLTGIGIVSQVRTLNAVAKTHAISMVGVRQGAPQA